LQLVNEYLEIIRAWEAHRRDFIRERFRRVAFMTRYGHIGYEEALAIPAWEGRMFREAIDWLLESESKKTGLPPVND